MRNFPTVEFFPESHIYLVNGTPTLSVTQILDANSIYPKFGKSDEAAKFGIIGHDIIKKKFDNNLGGWHPSFDPWMAGIEKFFLEQNPQAVHTEFIMGSTRKCGTIDFIGTVRDLSKHKNVCILDWKFWSTASKTVLRCAGFQTAGYVDLFTQGKRKTEARGVVHFFENGYQIYWLTDNHDSVIFQSLENVARLKLEMGLFKFKEAIDETFTD
jgi:hypothetical protein